jgi:hypothetical protein
MAGLGEALHALLAADAAVAALAGSRIYPNLVPAAASYPAIAYQRISGRRVHSQTGPSGLAAPRVQITSLAASYAQADALGQAVRQALDGYVGTVAGVELQASFIENEEDDHYNSAADENDLHVVRQDYFFWHREVA